MPSAQISFNNNTFDPKRITAVQHTLATHPLLQLEPLRRLAGRLPVKQVRFHAITARADSNFERATEQHKHTLLLDEALADIERSGSWIALHNVQSDPIYKALLDEVLDDVDRRIGPKDPGMFNRAFWIFIQSPGSVTPFHMDHENNFLLQIRGRKSAMIWHPEDSLSAEALEIFHAKFTRREASYDHSIDPAAHEFALAPGAGAYMPATCPHLVRNLDQVAITISMTYCTTETHRIEMINRGNHALRRLGLTPQKVGDRPWRDALSYGLYNTYQLAKDLARGQPRHVPEWARV